MAEDKERQERLERVRKRLAQRSGSRAVDPTEWRPPKVAPTQKLSFKLIVLPPLKSGDRCATGIAKTDMMELYDYRAGTHWIENRPYECPRLHDGVECPYCQLGFDLIGETEDKEQRRQLAKTYLPREVRAINIYFPPFKTNPPEVRGKVFWMAVSQKSIYQLFDECLKRNEDDAKGDTSEEDQAWGFFYEPDESYVFNLVIKHKNQYNDYSESKFLASTRGPMIANADGSMNVDKVKAILNQRHDLGQKFSPRDAAKLKELANKILTPDTNSGGFDEVEADTLVEEPASTVAPSPTDDDELVDMEESVAETAAATPVTAKATQTAKVAPTVKTTVKTTAKPAVNISDESELDKEVNALLEEIQEQ